jgi:1-pyrroline-4-hydroxy-2-carboxylate deaminase
MNVDWNGIYPAVTTKFHENGSLDLKTFRKNIEAQINAGIHGVVLGGTLGEASTLKSNEKLQLVEHTLELADGRIPVILNIAEQSTGDAVTAAQNAENNGASGLMLLPPMRYKADDRETLEFFKEVAGSTSLPIMIYNNPIDYGIEVTLEMFNELIEFDNIQAVKESTRDITNVTRLINRFGDRIKILCGVDTIALEALLLGASGWVAGLVCAFPRETVAIYEHAKSGNIQDALKIYRWFMPLLELDINPKLVQNIKLAESATGIGTEYVRKPRLELAGEERKQVQKIINDALEARQEIEYLINNQKDIVQ